MDRLLVPVDGSECSLHAVDFAARLAAKLHAEIVICSVVDLAKAAAMSGAEPMLLQTCYEELQSQAHYFVESAVKHVGIAAPVVTRSAEGAPIAEILQLAREINPLCVVMGSHGRSGFKRLFVGSVAEGVTRESPVPVIVVPIEHLVTQSAPNSVNRAAV